MLLNDRYWAELPELSEKIGQLLARFRRAALICCLQERVSFLSGHRRADGEIELHPLAPLRRFFNGKSGRGDQTVEFSNAFGALGAPPNRFAPAGTRQCTSTY
jgi:hypothetical protein